MKQNRVRRRQDERSAATQAKLLKSAVRLFGKKGYAKTSLEDIAYHAELTIGAIYHHFSNKKQLFAASNDLMEQKIIDVLLDNNAGTTIVAGWEKFLDLCDDAGFRQIVLIDAPKILGRERWSNTAVTRKVEQLSGTSALLNNQTDYERLLKLRMMMGALAEAALVIADADNPPAAKQAAQKIVRKISNID